MKRLEATLGLVAAIALFAMMALTFADVIGRKLLGASIPGSLELTELLMLAVIFVALPLTSLHGEHVVFDLLESLPAATGARRNWRALSSRSSGLSRRLRSTDAVAARSSCAVPRAARIAPGGDLRDARTPGRRFHLPAVENGR